MNERMYMYSVGKLIHWSIEKTGSADVNLIFGVFGLMDI